MRPPTAIYSVYNYFCKSLPWIIVCQTSYPLWQQASLKFQLCGHDNPVMKENGFYLLSNDIRIFQSTTEKQNFPFN